MSARASDADREAAVAALGKHCAAGRIDLAAMEHRIVAVTHATTLADVRAVLADLEPLPGPEGVPFRPVPPAGRLARTLGKALRRGGPGR